VRGEFVKRLCESLETSHIARRRPNPVKSAIRSADGVGVQRSKKFCLIADIVTHLVGVAEKEPSDFLVEQGLLVGTTEYFSKSHVLKRTYEDEEHPFGWMQDGVFELFDQEERLYCWRTEEDLVEVASKLP
ncbi:hypothetical protein PM030_16650, partial [Halorubrum ezzemoulense]|nr:hypothetical protein [Halorubrum ezzemoulense]